MQRKITQLDRQEILRYLGWKGGALTPQMEQLLSECIQSTLDTIRPAYRYQLFPLEKVQQGIAVTGTGLVLTGTSIVRHLEGCDSAYLLAGTIGLAHEQLLRKTMLIRPDAGVVLDSCGSAAAEAVAELADQEIQAQAAAQGKFCTPRFSPGYGDLPLTCQQPLLDALRGLQTLGMTVNSGGLLSPNKSVTAIIGVRDTPVTQTLSPCDACLKRGDCEFRRRNQVCYQSKQG